MFVSRRLALLAGMAIGLSHGLFVMPLTAGPFQTALQTETRLSVREGTLRELVQAVADVQDVTVFIDPRVDPRALVVAPDESQQLLQLFDRIALHANARARTIGETVLITPLRDHDRIASLAAKRDAELTDQPSEQINLSLLRPANFHPQPQPATPTELLTLIQEQFDLNVAGSPLDHDLWRVQLREVTAAEALACTLVPMGKSFEWTDSGIQIVDLPDIIEVSRSHYIPSGRSHEFVLESLQTVLGPSREPTQLTRKLLAFDGTLAEHEQLASLLQPHSRSGRKTSPKQKRYTLTVADRRAIEILKALEADGVDFDWDPAALMTSGVDLESVVSVDVKQVSAAELIESIAVQIGAKVIIEDDRPVLIEK